MLHILETHKRLNVPWPFNTSLWLSQCCVLRKPFSENDKHWDCTDAVVRGFSPGRLRRTSTKWMLKANVASSTLAGPILDCGVHFWMHSRQENFSIRAATGSLWYLKNNLRTVASVCIPVAFIVQTVSPTIGSLFVICWTFERKYYTLQTEIVACDGQFSWGKIRVCNFCVICPHKPWCILLTTAFTMYRYCEIIPQMTELISNAYGGFLTSGSLMHAAPWVQ